MAASEEHTGEEQVHHSDREADFINTTAAKYEAADEARVRAEDGLEEVATDEQDGGKKGGAKPKAGASETDGTDEQPKAGTPKAKRDGAASGSDQGSEEGEAGEHTETDSTDESDDAGEEGEEAEEGAEEGEEGEEGDQGEQEEGDEELELSEDLEAVAARHDIPVTLEDITDPVAKKVVKAKLAAIDAGYTRAMQEARSYRSEEAKFRADQRFREENPLLVTAELIESMLEKDPEFVSKLQDRLDKNAASDDSKRLFGMDIADARRKAEDAVKADMAKLDRITTRAEEVESYAKKVAGKMGLPWRLAEKEIERALLRKPADQRDLTEKEIAEVIREEAELYSREQRAGKRSASKAHVQQRTETRAAASASAVPQKARAARGSAIPRPAGGEKKSTYNDDDENSRHEHMMRTARRVMPGRK